MKKPSNRLAAALAIGAAITSVAGFGPAPASAQTASACSTGISGLNGWASCPIPASPTTGGYYAKLYCQSVRGPYYTADGPRVYFNTVRRIRQQNSSGAGLHNVTVALANLSVATCATGDKPKWVYTYFI